MEIEYDKFVNWLDHFGLPNIPYPLLRTHNAYRSEQVISEIKPKTLFPVHTEHPALYARFVSGPVKVKLAQLDVENLS